MSQNGQSALTENLLRPGNPQGQTLLERLLWKLSREYRRRLLRLILDWD